MLNRFNNMLHKTVNKLCAQEIKQISYNKVNKNIAFSIIQFL